MAQRKSKAVKEKPVNAPKRIWMINFIGSYVEVSEIYLWIKFAKSSRKIQYRVDGKSLHSMLSGNVKEKRYIGNLQFSVHERDSGEIVVMIEPDEKADFQFCFDVNKKELEEALYSFVG